MGLILTPTLMVLFIVSFVPFTHSFAQQPSSTSTTTTNRIFYMFNSHVPDVNETKLGIPADLFIPSSITVNKGDIITIHFYNVEENEPHTFTLDQPYSIDENVLGGHNSTIVFKADHEGIYQYYCKYHLPTMTGQLIVK